MQHLGDITKISGYHAPVVDCIIGGSPCQDLSVAGKRAGLAGERSGLFMEQIRIVKEMRQRERDIGRSGKSVRPRYMVWENVPGAFSSNQGKDFAAVLEETIRIAEPEAPDIPVPEKGWPTSGCLMGEGWSVAWRVLDAQFCGVPQRRRRIALVADFGGQSAPEILFVRKGMSGDIEESGDKRQETAGNAENCSGTADCKIKCASALSHRDSRGNQMHSGIDNGLEVYFWDGTQTASTLTANNANGGQRMPDKVNFNCVVEKRSFLPTPTNGDRRAVVWCIGNGQAAQTNLSPIVGTLNCMHDQQAVCYGVDCRNGSESLNLYPTLQAKPNGGQSLNFSGAVRQNYLIRRLTPLECERLQGFPDGWTDIGEWVDSKGKKHKEADSPRYKALGNSIALPPWKWVLKRICAQYERDATMASLFDGIGGFPLIWEQLNGKGSCLWASEIEEFPIAVTKLRFGGD